MSGTASGAQYSHDQSAPGLPIAMAVVTIAAAVALVLGDAPPATTALITVLLAAVTVIGWAMSKLTVTITGTTLTVAFRFGRPSREFDIDQLVSVEQVRNHWLYGWGVRWIKGGRMYNVWGLDAVQLGLRSGKIFRIGTDEPEALLDAIRSARL